MTPPRRAEADRVTASAGGLLITLDGPGGIGKTTLTHTLADHLTTAGHTVHTTREPSDRPLGAFTRAHADHLHAHALACLVAADRHDHLRHEIRPALATGATVTCDRYLASSLVLQAIDGVATDDILAINTGIDLPDLAVILTAHPSTIQARLTARGPHHRFEHDPTASTRETTLYTHAATLLTTLGVAVLTIDTEHLTPSGAAAAITTAVHHRASSLTRHGRHRLGHRQ